MRTIVDIPEDKIARLDHLGKTEGLSRAELVRRAIDRYLDEQTETVKAHLDRYCGLFKDDPTAFDGLDGVAYQEKMREDWSDRETAIDSRVSENRGLQDNPHSDYKHKGK
jgi:hypothetical protein